MSIPGSSRTWRAGYAMLDRARRPAGGSRQPVPATGRCAGRLDRRRSVEPPGDRNARNARSCIARRGPALIKDPFSTPFCPDPWAFEKRNSRRQDGETPAPARPGSSARLSRWARSAIAEAAHALTDGAPACRDRGLCRPRGGLVNGDGDSCSHTFNIAADRARPGRIVIGLLRSHGFDRAGHGSAEPASSVVTRIPVVSAARGHPLALNTDETHHEPKPSHVAHSHPPRVSAADARPPRWDDEVPKFHHHRQPMPGSRWRHEGHPS